MGTIFKALEKLQRSIEYKKSAVNSFNTNTLSELHNDQITKTNKKNIQGNSDLKILTKMESLSDEEDQTYLLNGRNIFPEEYQKK